MKILHVIGSMDPRRGGPCQGIRNLATRMVEAGNTVEVVCLDDPRSEYLSGETMRIHALARGWGSWNYHPQLLPWLKGNLPRFDAIILNGLWQHPGYALSRVAGRPDMPPYFIFPHGMLDPWFQNAPDRRLKAARNWLYWKLIEQRVIQNAGAILFTCQEEMRLAQKTFQPFRPKREINVGYGVAHPPDYRGNMEKAFGERCPGLGEMPYLLFLSRIHPKKGVDLLIKAYGLLCRSRGGSSLPKLVIAGPGLETPYGQSMRKLGAELCPPGSLFWPGMLTGDAKWGALYHCEASVLPSHQENFGITVVETLACGRPVLISDQVNIWREIKEAGAALVQENSVAGAAQLFTDWLSLPAEARSHMSAKAKICFQRSFSIESAARNLLTAINS